MAPHSRQIKKGTLPEKEYILRNSLLIDLFESSHILCAAYQLFVALFVGLCVNAAVDSYKTNSQTFPGFRLIIQTFRKFHIAMLGWLCLFLVTCLWFYLFKIWANFRNNSIKIFQFWDLLWLMVTMVYYFSSFIISSWFTLFFQLPPASSAIICLEQTRLLMKLHAFLRVNVEKTIRHKSHSEQDSLKPATFSKFLYFLFIPTLIYRDEYPRTEKIRFNFVLFRLFEFLSAVLCLSIVFERFLGQDFNEFSKRTFTMKEIILIILENSLYGMMVLLLCFFIVLHSWQNLFAELTRFGDRLFYKDWWTSVAFSEWFRKWNIVVHDWLYTYIYKDMCEILTNNYRVLSKFTVFLISAIVHEWVVCYMFGFFCPLLFMEFSIGILLNFVEPPKKPLLNLLLLYSLALGVSSLICMYTIEYYTRTNIPIVNPSFSNYFVPRFLTCNSTAF